ncbi:MAG: zinc ABC transporter substrate-binding protein [Muribaculaceae bacterium]|nr:zinc ABC transporter substrate-binding protein [Muribaculaceae bacterium]
MKTRYLMLSMILILSLSLMMMTGCSYNNHDDSRPTIAVSYGAQAWLLRNIAGDLVKVVELLPPGADPEIFDPTISTLKDTQHSRYYLTMSTPGFEQRLIEMIKENFPHVQVCDVTSGIELISGTHEHPAGYTADSHIEDHGHEKGAGHHHDMDPHLLSSVRNAGIISDNMLAVLCEMDPDNAASYKANHAVLTARLDSLDLAIAAGVKNGERDRKSKTYIVMHPMLSYPARDYGLRQVALEESGKEASPRYLKESIEYAREANPFAFFIERGHKAPQMTEIARHLDIPLYEIYLTGDDWFENMKQLGSHLADP